MVEMGRDVPGWDESDWEQASAYSHLEYMASDVGYDTENSWHVVLDDNDDDNNEEATPYSRRPSQSSISAVAAPRCEHWTSRRCSLTRSPRQCCACSDSRRESATGLYEAYIDGTGFLEAVERWAYYCPGCKASAATERPASGNGSSKEDSVTGQSHKSLYEAPRTRVRDSQAHSPARTQTSPAEKTNTSGQHTHTGTAPAGLSASPKAASATSGAATAAAIAVASHQRSIARGLLYQATRCEHWLPRDCHLTATLGKCCECADARHRSKAATYYAVYLDGGPSISGAERYMFYCPGCKTALEARHGPAVRIGVARDRERLVWQDQRQRQRQRQQCARAEEEEEERHGAVLCANKGRTLTTAAAAVAGDQADSRAGHTHKHDRPVRMWGCEHWYLFDCSLTAKRRLCCGCSDTREKAAAYVKYVDGQGDVLAATQWEYYCPGCQKAGSEMAGRKDRGLRYLSWLRRKKDVATTTTTTMTTDEVS